MDFTTTTTTSSSSSDNEYAWDNDNDVSSRVRIHLHDHDDNDNTTRNKFTSKRDKMRHSENNHTGLLDAREKQSIHELVRDAVRESTRVISVF